MSLPPREVPKGLTAAEYYQLGVEYRAMGWTEQARDALMLALEENSDSEVAMAAKRFLRTKLPKFPVPLVAEQKTIDGFNQMAGGNLVTARQTFEELIKTYPDFEWPYGYLSILCMQEGQTEKAKELLTKALAINSDYVSGWLHMATAKGLELDFKGARQCVAKAIESDPTDAAALAMKEALDQLPEA